VLVTLTTDVVKESDTVLDIVNYVVEHFLRPRESRSSLQMLL